MDVALHSNMIVIRASRQQLSKPWISGFISQFKDELLFLNKAVIIYHNEQQTEEKRDFLEKVCISFAQKENLDASFFIKAIMCCLHYPIRIETAALPSLHKEIHVHLKVIENSVVSMTLPESDPWFLLYMHSKLNEYVLKRSHKDLFLELVSIDAKIAFERSLNRNHIFSRKIAYHYNKDFIQKLFASSIEPEMIEQAMMHDYYKVLECSIGATMQEVKSNYKRLVKQYHPDIIQHLQNDEKVNEYTQKFQVLQEAYEALKGA